ncbi:MAG: fructose-1,6-bisphosphatase, partial [Myxococcales bacterium]|nr:fructose-1,6-bisphosphatase [Myxococcales bacterium]
TIFAIYRRLPDAPGPAHLLRPGREQVAAGYIIYGSSTVLVYTDGRTVDCFTLDPGSGEFFLTRAAMAYRPVTRILSLNECNGPYWPGWVSPFLDEIKGRNDAEARRVTDRHIGSLVADFHRNLVKGGLFLYPVDARTGRGKLRLLYECNPLAFIAEVAGGAASWGGGRILDVQPTSLHQRTGLIIGAQADVALAERFVAEHG